MSEDVGESATGGGPGDRILPWAQVQALTGVSRTTAWRMRRTGEFPRSVVLSPGRVGWWESELAAWRKTRGGRVFAPPSRPRPAESTRRMRPPEPSACLPQEAEAQEASRPRATLAPRGVRRRVFVHPDQIDFGF
ncbi:Prophage CP4-57 regulatory protein (AlpA) [compost metagenome]